MALDMYVREKLLADYRRDILREMEQRRMVAHVSQQHIGRRVVGHVGKSLVTLGTWLEQFEHRESLVPAKR